MGNDIELKSSDFEEDRYGRLRLIPWWDQERLKNATIMVVGAGAIGNYDCCSFNFSGEGSFRPQEGAKPFVGELGKVHFESEVQVEVICTRLVLSGVIKALVKAPAK